MRRRKKKKGSWGVWDMTMWRRKFYLLGGIIATDVHGFL